MYNQGYLLASILYKTVMSVGLKFCNLILHHGKIHKRRIFTSKLLKEPLETLLFVYFWNKNTQINKFPNFVATFINFVICLQSMISGITVVFLTFVTHYIKTDQLSPDNKICVLI